jgi:hypothetical protein
MSNDRFDPHSLGVAGVGAAATLAFAMVAGVRGMVDDIADAVAERTDEQRWETINELMESTLARHEAMRIMIEDQQATMDTLYATIERLYGVIERQAAAAR